MEQSVETARVLKVFNELKKAKKIEGVGDFCNKMEFDSSAFSQIKTGNRNAPLSLQHKIIDTFNVNRDFIFNGKEPMFNPIVEVRNKATLPKEKEKLVPYYNVDATAGNVTIFDGGGLEYIKEYIAVPAFQDCDMFIGISGNSMYPKYCAGELIALKKLQDYDVIAFGEAYLVVTKEQRLLKYIRKPLIKEDIGKKWRLCSENPEFEDFEIETKKVLHLYIIKGKITKNIIKDA